MKKHILYFNYVNDIGGDRCAGLQITVDYEKRDGAEHNRQENAYHAIIMSPEFAGKLLHNLVIATEHSRSSIYNWAQQKTAASRGVRRDK